MDIDERFEHPAPVLSADAGEIALRAPAGAVCEGSITLKNTGGGLLSGSVASGADCLDFFPREFEGNKVTVRYRLSPGVSRPGGRIRANAVVTSNGGELVIPVTAEFTGPGIKAADGTAIADPADFLAYALNDPARAAELFSGPDFRDFLSGAGEPLRAYETVAGDPDRERALENYLVISGLKSKTVLYLKENSFEIELNPGDSRPVRGSLPLEREGRGYLDAPVRAERGVPWLSVKKSAEASDFGGGDAAALRFTVDPKTVKPSWDAERLYVGDGGLSAEITVRRRPPLEARLSREFFGMDDEGFLAIVNNTGGDLLIEVVPQEAFVRFSGVKFLVGERADIPFQVKFGAFQAAQTVVRKQPYVEAVIEVRSNTGYGRFRKRLKITAGEW
ncbi:MAG: DUF5717 family protein [Firmicutes bacterium]|nr:DUF5717 family protein [Bacillota bacterium]